LTKLNYYELLKITWRWLKSILQAVAQSPPEEDRTPGESYGPVQLSGLKPSPSDFPPSTPPDKSFFPGNTLQSVGELALLCGQRKTNGAPLPQLLSKHPPQIHPPPKFAHPPDANPHSASSPIPPTIPPKIEPTLLPPTRADDPWKLLQQHTVDKPLPLFSLSSQTKKVQNLDPARDNEFFQQPRHGRTKDIVPNLLCS